MAFLEQDCELRTDESFKLQIDEEFYKGTSPFTKLNVGLVSQVPLDALHLVYLGTMKRDITFWMRGPKNLRFSDTEKEDIDSEILTTTAFR